MSRVGIKILPLLAELVKNIGCEIILEDSDYDLLVFNDPKGRPLEIDLHQTQGSCRLILIELGAPYVEHCEREITCKRILYDGEIHYPDSLNKLKELIQSND